MQPRGGATAEGTGPDLLVLLEMSGQGTLRRRLRDALHDAIRSGRLPPGSRLPSSRALAADLGVSRGVAVDAYAQLSAEGFLVSRPGSGTVVADTGGQVLEHTASVQGGPAVSGQPPHEIEVRARSRLHGHGRPQRLRRRPPWHEKPSRRTSAWSRLLRSRTNPSRPSAGVSVTYHLSGNQTLHQTRGGSPADHPAPRAK